MICMSNMLVRKSEHATMAIWWKFITLLRLICVCRFIQIHSFASRWNSTALRHVGTNIISHLSHTTNWRANFPVHILSVHNSHAFPLTLSSRNGKKILKNFYLLCGEDFQFFHVCLLVKFSLCHNHSVAGLFFLHNLTFSSRVNKANTQNLRGKNLFIFLKS